MLKGRSTTRSEARGSRRERTVSERTEYTNLTETGGRALKRERSTREFRGRNERVFCLR